MGRKPEREKPSGKLPEGLEEGDTRDIVASRLNWSGRGKKKLAGKLPASTEEGQTRDIVAFPSTCAR